MSKDCSFEKIASVTHHPNADRLDIVKILGFEVIAPRDKYKVGDTVFYIREDAALMEYDRYKEWKRRESNLNEMHKNGRLSDEQYAKMSKPEYKWLAPWQEPFFGYLGAGGRVNTVQIRGVYSSGIIVSVEDVYAHINTDTAKNWEKDNIILNSEYPGNFVKGKFQIQHWCAANEGLGDASDRGHLPFGLRESDEERWESLEDYDIEYGGNCLVTKKMDGTSCMVVCCPDGDVHVCKRTRDLQLNCDNVYNRAAKEIIPLGLAWAKHYNKKIALRGEVVGNKIQGFSVNKDAVGEPTFYMYGANFPDETDMYNRLGRYGTDFHFLKIAEQIKELTGTEIRTVPIIEKDVVLTRELLEKYLHTPLEFGEGVVVNYLHGKGSCKSKSLAYQECIGKKNK